MILPLSGGLTLYLTLTSDVPSVGVTVIESDVLPPVTCDVTVVVCGPVPNGGGEVASGGDDGMDVLPPVT